MWLKPNVKAKFKTRVCRFRMNWVNLFWKLVFNGPSLRCCKSLASTAPPEATRCRYMAAYFLVNIGATVRLGAGLLSLSCSPTVPPPFTNPLTPDSENRWRGKWGFGAEEFTVSRETFTSIWVAHATFWNPIVTFQSGVNESSHSWWLRLLAWGKHRGAKIFLTNRT